MLVTVRRPLYSDIPQVLALSRALGSRYPEQPQPWEEAVRGESRLSTYAIAAMEHGEVVGYGCLRPDMPTHPTSGKFRLELGVAPEFRRQGIGRQLYGHLMIEFHTLGGKAVRARFDNEPEDVLGFLTALGFERYYQMLHMWQDVHELPAELPSPALPDGVTLTTLAAEGRDDSVLRKIYDLRNQFFADIPSPDPFVPAPYELFPKEMADPLILPDCFFLAKEGDRYVGMSYAARLTDDPTRIGVRHTGVLREFRRQGLATALKWPVSAYARAHGYRWVGTATAWTNYAMQAVNRAMGYRTVFTQNRFERVYA